MTFDALVGEINEQSNNPAKILDCLFAKIKAADERNGLPHRFDKWKFLEHYFTVLKRYVDVKLRLHRVRKFLDRQEQWGSVENVRDTHEICRLDDERFTLYGEKEELKRQFSELFGEEVPSIHYPGRSFNVTAQPYFAIVSPYKQQIVNAVPWNGELMGNPMPEPIILCN